MARVKDLWFAEVPVKDASGANVLDEHGRVVKERKKTSKHPDEGGNPNAKRWQAEWTDPKGKKPTRTFHKKTDAANHAKKMEGDADRGEYVEPKAGKELFGPLSRRYLKLRPLGARSRERMEGILTNHVDPVFAARKIGSVKPSEIVEWLQGPLAPYGVSVREAAFNMVRGTFDLAVADKIRRDNPARSDIVKPPKPGDPKPREVWRVSTAWKVIDAHPDRYRVIPICEAGLGLREGCAYALADDDFDFEAGKVHIRRQVFRYKGKSYFKLPKGGRERTVPMGRGVAAAVITHKDKYPPVQVTLPWMNEDGTIADEPCTVRLLSVWAGPKTTGQPIVANSYIAHVWLPALHKAGMAPLPERDSRGFLRYQSGGRENGQHALRHLFETTLDDGGVSLAGMMEFMGHSRKGKVITIGVYGHVTEATFERARVAVDGTLFKLRPIESDGTVTELAGFR
jgi:integrase